MIRIEKNLRDFQTDIKSLLLNTPYSADEFIKYYDKNTILYLLGLYYLLFLCSIC